MSRNIKFSDDAWEEYLYWQTFDKAKLKKINKLIKESQRDPLVGSGEPEALKSNLSGYYSRRIDDKNRLVYSVDQHTLTIVQCRYHYDDK